MKYPIPRRAALTALAGCAVLGPATGQEVWPSRPVRIVNPWPPGGPGDQIIRPIATKLQEALRQPIVVENRPGANGSLGAGIVAAAPPDGYTWYFAHTGAMTISPAVQSRLSYDPVRDFTPVTQILSLGSVLAVRGGLPVTTLAEFIAYARERPGQLNLGSIGVASTAHLFGEMLAAAAGLSFTHVPYLGAAPLVTDLLAGRVDLCLLGLPAVAPHTASGRVRLLGISSERPPRIMPELPTINRTLPGFETETWYGILGPAGVPPEIVARLHDALVQVIRSPEITDLLVRDSYEPVAGTPEAFGDRIRRDLVAYRALASRLDLRID